MSSRSVLFIISFFIPIKGKRNLSTIFIVATSSSQCGSSIRSPATAIVSLSFTFKSRAI